MIRSAAALVLAAALAAPAIAAEEPPADSAAPNAPPAASPLSPRRQPTPELLREREGERGDRPAARRQKAEQAEIDRLYQDVMRRSAPPPQTAR
jgi:hypothetical protein